MNKTGSISEWLDIYQLPIGAIGFCVGQMRGTLSQVGNQTALELAEEAARKHSLASQLTYDWEQQKTQDPITSDGARKLDDRIDRTLSLIQQGAQVYAGLEEESPKKRHADEFLDELFAAGVYPITSLSFTEQHGAVETLTERLTGEFADHVQKLDLGPLVEQLEDLNQEFGALLEADADQVVYDEVEAAYNEAEEAFHRLVIQVLCDYRDDMETFNEVMAPVHKQTELMRRHLSRRGGAPEIDPETGEPIEPTDGGESPVNDGGSPRESGGDETPDDNSPDDGESGDNSSSDGEES